MGCLTVLTLPLSPFDFGHVLQNLQFVFVFPLCYLIGIGLVIFLGSCAATGLLLLYFRFAIVALFFGFVETFLGKSIWDSVDLYSFFYYSMGFLDPMSPVFGLPRSWVSWDFVFFLNNGVVRMVSFFVEPVGFGRFVGIGIIVGWYLRKNLIISKQLYLFFLFFSVVALILCVSKGGFVTLAIFIFLTRFGVIATSSLFVGLAGVSVLLLFGGSLEALGPSVANHLSSFVNAIVTVVDNPMGQGVSSNDVEFANEMIEISNDFVTAKSEGGLALFSIFFGFLGFVCYLWMIYLVAPKNEADDELEFVQAGCFSVLLSGIFAHSAFSIVGAGFVFIMLGYCSGKRMLADV